MAHEHVTIVDEHDRPISSKGIRDITANDIYRVSVLWLTNSNGEILFAQRALRHPNAPGVWGTAVAGSLEDGETYESNIYAEAAEEIGLTGVKFQLGPKRFNDEGHRRHFDQWFTGVVDWPLHKFKLQADEVAQIAWLSPEQFQHEIAHQPGKYFPSARHWAELFIK